VPSSTLAVPPPTIARHHGLDWLRIGAFGFLILFHIGMFFVPGNWIVKTERPIHWIGYPMLALMPWRLPLLFVVSGYASRALLSKLPDPGRFALSRSRRLLIPLLFGVAIIVPPQTWVRMIEHHGYSGSFGHFWMVDWFGFNTLDGVQLPNTEHLWFVVSLWLYSMLLAAALAFSGPALRDRAQQAIDWLAVDARLLWAPLVVLETIRMAMLFTVSESHGLLDDWVGDAIYVPAFLFGFALAGRPRLWPPILRLWKPALALALVCYAAIVWIEHRYGEVGPHLPHAIRRACELAMGWSAILLLLGVADRWLARDHAWRKTLSEAVFPFYLIHQTIIVMTGWWLRDRGLSAFSEFVMMLAATILGCWFFYRIGREIGWLRPLIGLGPVVPARAETRAAPDEARDGAPSAGAGPLLDP
jgi:surface polysaccharide O-acyltransferase-like enzyme